MSLVLANRQRACKINRRRLHEIAAVLLAELAGPEAILEINLVGPAQMAKVNQTFLRHEGPTDVITFDYREETGPGVPPGLPAFPPVPGKAAARPKTPSRPVRTLKRPEGRAPKSPPGGGPLHGELFICPAVAVAQAREFGTDWRSELVRYVIHGLLHLLGHDDRQPAARRRMKQAEGRRLRDISRRFALSKL